MWVKETFPPRPRLRLLLITVRLSIINFAGIARTLVAVGTDNEASMLCTTRALTPRIGSRVAAPGVTRVGIGLTIGSAGVGVGLAICVLATTGAAATGGAETGGATGATTGAGAAT